MNKRSRRAAGFTIFEMAFMVGLLGLFALLASQLFNAMMQVSKHSRQAELTVGQWDEAIRRLRADVWSARATRLDAEGVLTVEPPVGESARWWVDAERAELVRQSVSAADPKTQRWGPLGGVPQLELRGQAVVVRRVATRSAPASESWLISQLQLLQAKDCQ